jgi:hypothetical protein
MMRTIFDKITRDGLIDRINLITTETKAEWGKMTVYQMVRHCTLYEEMMLGKTRFKRTFLGYLFGRMALRSLTKNESLLRKNTPTIPALVESSHTGDIAAEKKKWIALIEEYGGDPHGNIIHPFFGRIEKEQIGYLVYKHADHHLRQFNC